MLAFALPSAPLTERQQRRGRRRFFLFRHLSSPHHAMVAIIQRAAYRVRAAVMPSFPPTLPVFATAALVLGDPPR